MLLSRKKKADVLAGLPLFSECSRRELDAVAAVADELRLPAGREVMRQGARGRELVVLLDGEVEVSRNGEVLATRGPGDFLGELALVTHQPRVATVTATTDLRVLVLERGAFERLVREVPSIALKVLKAVGERLPAEDA
ncbi:MAG: cyclic nucleotide-binding protein [Gaiellaceae bacterium]|nr:cyclic nucleotide-binding protein [Gaiellaceae bacterium]